MYLKVNDLTISDNGGLINVDVENKNSFSGTQQADGISDNLPTITIDGASADKNSFGNNKLVQADIGIFGDITNSAGDVKITSDNYNTLTFEVGQFKDQDLYGSVKFTLHKPSYNLDDEIEIFEDFYAMREKQTAEKNKTKEAVKK